MPDFTEFQHALEAVRVQLGRYSVTLVTTDAENNPCQIGSGTCVDLGGRRGIFTAAHVVLDAPVNCISVILPERAGLNSFVRSVHLEGGREEDVGRAADPIDVAFLELSEEGIQVLSSFKQFLNLDRIESGVAYRERPFMVYGTPSALVSQEAIARKELPVIPICYATEATQQRPAGTTMADHIVLEYPQLGNIWGATGRELDVTREPEATLLRDPRGISGGGIWTMRSVDSPIWSPESAVLVGIETGWRPVSRLIVGNQIQHAIAVADKPVRGTQ
ncbi:hypothetical protein BLA39750_00986 [Burkholderia lata]|uniref:Uncharacterized protein n=2 Tax=Burkholderia lata (strain ATCC 17760 / DSM 23089 / LMG 22485 / NCIMB 9086 / R18194 / 383) TaxID=482957 RepID=A0A6P2VBI1_BURL3|nr:hypothetical protein BLA39750_00986 [Burkholderia lata]